MRQLGILLGMMGLYALTDSLRADEKPLTPQIAMERLGARSFSQRIAAEAVLLESGPRVLPLLESGLKHSNPEVRLRIESLIVRVSKSQMGAVISEFMAPGSKTTLPGWDVVAEIVGDRSETRTVYGQLLKGDPALTAALFRPESVETELRRRGFPGMPRGREFSVASPLALLILLTHPDANHPDETVQSISNLLRSLVNRVENSPEDQMNLALVAYWVAQPAPRVAQQRFDLAYRLGLPEAIHPAIELIEHPRRQFQVYEPFAIVARYGGAEEMAILEKLLTDTTELSASRGENDVVTSTTELRDFALVTLIEMTKQDPAEYNLKPFRRDHEGQLRNLTVGFESATARKEAFDKWRAWSSKNLRKFQAPPNNAAEGTAL